MFHDNNDLMVFSNNGLSYHFQEMPIYLYVELLEDLSGVFSNGFVILCRKRKNRRASA